MANNRMWLVFRPLAIGVMVGKTMGAGWYTSLDNKNLREFLDFCLEENDCGNYEDFTLLREDQPGWDYVHDESPGGYQKFKFLEE